MAATHKSSAPADSSAPRHASTQPDGGGIAFAILRIAVPLLYAIGFYTCTFFLQTGLAMLLLGLLFAGSAAWLAACLRVPDEHRASHLALQGFLIKALTLPLEVLVIVVYATLITMRSYQVVPGMWFLLIALLYLGILGGSIHVIAAARAAHSSGLLAKGWARTFQVCAALPVADLAAGIFLWFALLRRRLLGEE